MPPAGTSATAAERELLQAASAGDEGAYRRLVEAYRAELHAHCYRMLGSVHDAEDALQEAWLRAWRALARFEGRSSLRSWLYAIATNACLDAIARRRRRVLPVDFGPAADPRRGPGEPVVESVWMEPYPDEQMGLADGFAAPEARYEQREGVELAFVAALQHLPATQRAVLIMREVLGFSGREVAESLGTTVPAVNSALQRARRAVEERLPERSDVDAVVGMLAEDAAWSMPPLAAWFGGLDALRAFLARGPLSGDWRWRHVPTRASGQPAVGVYSWDARERSHLPFALDVLTLDGPRIKQVTAFITRSARGRDREFYARWPEQPLDRARVEAYFGRFGLPARVD